MRPLLGLLALALAAHLASCASALPEARVVEGDQDAMVAGHGVALGAISAQGRFRNGRRITVLRATLFVRDREGLRKQTVDEGDDLLIAGERWIVVEVRQGTPATAGSVLLRKAPKD